jgi:hypothetical protein
MPKTDLNNLKLLQTAYGRQPEQLKDTSTASSTEVIDKEGRINTAFAAYQNSLDHALSVGNQQAIDLIQKAQQLLEEANSSDDEISSALLFLAAQKTYKDAYLVSAKTVLQNNNVITRDKNPFRNAGYNSGIEPINTENNFFEKAAEALNNNNPLTAGLYAQAGLAERKSEFLHHITAEDYNNDINFEKIREIDAAKRAQADKQEKDREKYIKYPISAAPCYIDRLIPLESLLLKTHFKEIEHYRNAIDCYARAAVISGDKLFEQLPKNEQHRIILLEKAGKSYEAALAVDRTHFFNLVEEIKTHPSILEPFDKQPSMEIDPQSFLGKRTMYLSAGTNFKNITLRYATDENLSRILEARGDLLILKAAYPNSIEDSSCKIRLSFLEALSDSYSHNPITENNMNRVDRIREEIKNGQMNNEVTEELQDREAEVKRLKEERALELERQNQYNVCPVPTCTIS